MQAQVSAKHNHDLKLFFFNALRLFFDNMSTNAISLPAAMVLKKDISQWDVHQNNAVMFDIMLCWTVLKFPILCSKMQ